MNTATVDSPSLEPGAAPQLMSRGMLLRASIVFLLLSTTVLQRFGLNLGTTRPT